LFYTPITNDIIGIGQQSYFLLPFNYEILPVEVCKGAVKDKARDHESQQT
jgi:hypothetical protein